MLLGGGWAGHVSPESLNINWILWICIVLDVAGGGRRRIIENVLNCIDYHGLGMGWWWRGAPEAWYSQGIRTMCVIGGWICFRHLLGFIRDSQILQTDNYEIPFVEIPEQPIKEKCKLLGNNTPTRTEYNLLKKKTTYSGRVQPTRQNHNYLLWSEALAVKISPI